MIEDLDFGKLVEYGFDEDAILRLREWEGHHLQMTNNKGFFYVSTIDRKIYSGVDAARKIYFRDSSNWAFINEMSPDTRNKSQSDFPIGFPELLAEFYQRRLEVFLISQREFAKELYYESEEIESFLSSEIETTQNTIYNTLEQRKGVQLNLQPKIDRIPLRETELYLKFLKREYEKLGMVGVKKNIKEGSKNNHYKEQFDPSFFGDIFSNTDWEKYIQALEKTTPKLLNANRDFVGKPTKHKGVVCSWIKTLQTKGIVKQNINRSQLANVLNNELKGFNIGKDGKTFDNFSKEYHNSFEKQLLKLVE